MIRFAVVGIVTSCVGAAILFAACGDSSFSASPEIDARADVEVADAPFSAADSASDGAVAVVGDAGRILPIACVDGGHSLCDTFDEAKISDFWMVSSACSQPFLDTATSVSAPSSLSTNDVSVPLNCASVFALVPSPLNAKFSASFDVLVDSPNQTAFAPFFAIWISTADYTFYEIALTTNAAGAIDMLENLNYLDDAGSASPTTPINGVTLVKNAWNHVDFNVNLSGSNFVDVAINDGPIRAVPLQHRPSAGSVTLYRPYLGIPNGGLSKAAAHFDDFVCDVTP